VIEGEATSTSFRLTDNAPAETVTAEEEEVSGLLGIVFIFFTGVAITGALAVLLFSGVFISRGVCSSTRLMIVCVCVFILWKAESVQSKEERLSSLAQRGWKRNRIPSSTF